MWPYAGRNVSMPSSAVDLGRAWMVFLALLCCACEVRAAEGPACKRARLITAELASAIRDGQVPLDAAGRLETAKSLCAQLAEIWDVAYCLAKAKGDKTGADSYRKRGALSGLDGFTCDAEVAPAGRSPARPDPPLGPVRRKHALVVGVGSFQDSRIPTLRYAAKDARDFARALVEQSGFAPGSVRLLVDQLATRAGILGQLQEMITGTGPDDLAVLYFSSHGSPRQEAKGLGGIGYLVTYDTNLDRLWLDALEYQSLSEKVSLVPARRIVTFLDSCYSGQVQPPGAKQLFVEAGIDEKTAQQFLSGEGTFLVTSSRADQRSWESDELKNSFFTYYIIEAMKAKPLATLGETFDYFSSRVAQRVSQEKSAQQNPQIFPKSPPADLRIGVTASSRSNE